MAWRGEVQVLQEEEARMGRNDAQLEIPLLVKEHTVEKLEGREAPGEK